LEELTYSLTAKKAWPGLNELYRTLLKEIDKGRKGCPQELLDRLHYLTLRYHNLTGVEQKKDNHILDNNYYAFLLAYHTNSLQTFLANNPRFLVEFDTESDQEFDHEVDIGVATPEELPGSAPDKQLPAGEEQSPDGQTQPAAETPVTAGPPVTNTETAPTPLQSPQTPEITAEESYLTGFFNYGLVLEGFRVTVQYARRLPPPLILEAARILHGREYFYHAINLMYYYLGRKHAVPTLAECQLLYPRGYAEHIEPLARELGLPSYLLYALVWSESGFKPNIKSPAGAIGLSQLMPATAQEMAQRLKITNPDFTNPADNLRIGTHYYARLYQQFNNAAKAFIAYNAGPTRMRNWAKQLAHFQEELLPEVLPITETRKYVRKIINAAVFYDYLYGNQSPTEVIRFFYPGLPLPPVKQAEEKKPVTRQVYKP
jgi:soluble lytic murein transglycosylase